MCEQHKQLTSQPFRRSDEVSSLFIKLSPQGPDARLTTGTCLQRVRKTTPIHSTFPVCVRRTYNRGQNPYQTKKPYVLSLPSSSSTSRAALLCGGASTRLRNDVSVITSHEVALGNLSLLLLQDSVQLLVTYTRKTCQYRRFDKGLVDVAGMTLF